MIDDDGLEQQEEIIQESERLPDGSIIYDIFEPGEGPAMEEQINIEDIDFYENVAPRIEDKVLNNLSEQLLEEISGDFDSRSEWVNNNALAAKYLGYSPEQFNESSGFFKACRAYDSTMSKTLLDTYAVLRAELFPSQGPSNSKITGTPTKLVEEKAERIPLFMNYYLTAYDKSYYPDSEKLLLYTSFFGSSFRKVWQDPVLNEPRCRFVSADDLVIDYSAVDLLSSPRITQVIQLSRQDIILLERSKDFLEEELTDDDSVDGNESNIKVALDKITGINKDEGGKKNLFKYYESHVYLDSKTELPGDPLVDGDDEFPRPYTVTINASSKKIVSVKRNWVQADTKFKRKEHYVHYRYLPGFGIYGIGLGVLLASHSIASTTLLRTTLDSTYFSMFPAYLKSKSLNSENNDVGLMPGEGREIDTMDKPIGDCIMKMPYDGPSQVAIALREQLKEEAASHGASGQTPLEDLGANAPTGTTMAVLDVSGRIQSTVIRSLRDSLTQEFSMLFNLFKEFLPENSPYPFSVPGKSLFIMKDDFIDEIQIVPVSDPNAVTNMHRIIRNESILKIAQMYPQMHNMHAILERFYQSMNVDEIDSILLPEPVPLPLDPVSENMCVVLGKPIKTDLTQDDESHITIHKSAIQDPILQSFFQANPAAYAALMLHTQEHEANAVFKSIQQHQQQQQQQMIGNMPQQQPYTPYQDHMQQSGFNNQTDNGNEQQPNVQTIPEIQNAVAQKNAKDYLDQMQITTYKQEEAASRQIDPNQVLLQEIEQRREAAHLKHQESEQDVEIQKYKIDMAHQESIAKYEIEKYKAHVKHEAEMAQISANLAMADNKNKVDLIIEEHKGSSGPKKELYNNISENDV